MTGIKCLSLLHKIIVYGRSPQLPTSKWTFRCLSDELGPLDPSSMISHAYALATIKRHQVGGTPITAIIDVISFF